ncbi:MAG: 2-aminoethylphosphonate--pyruvate transaminase [Cyclobacteriaceae bacterium]|nr:2-aminoethylphosphonate--pyruvate transaminase [Cyclobacteriaceae bacterium]MCB0500417.1 2-aminoethylphosphonate--pyruvate transaminase [Cyclobacteriaceae bacterium]MCB9236768.1 2-aminoethylphosphonate--pyruvate transaminase [Flammeovirgaceae bacterium]MCW5902047.1 2-aminoethylphosphonate--pyruvate transaminase [Cyclobacteriaceae bacterium]
MKTVSRKILLNPGPATTTQTVKEAMIVEDICPREKDFGKMLDSIKDDLVKIVHGTETHHAVMFAASGTGGLEAAITSAVPEGKKLLVVENGAYGTRMVKIAQTFHIGVVRYQIDYGDYPDLNEIENLLKANPGISHLAVVHHETTTGMLNPVQAICDLAHRYKTEVIVDCMSSYAGMPIDITQWDAEYLISSSNKCIQGMPGLVFVIFKKNLLDKIRETHRSFYFDIYNQFTGFEKTGQMQFTPPVQVAYALRTAIDEYFAETEAGRWNRYRENHKTLYNGLASMGFEFLLPDNQQSNILLAIKEPAWEGYSFDAMHDYLYARGFTIYPGKGAKEATFRLSVLGDLHKKDIEGFLKCLGDYLSNIKK